MMVSIGTVTVLRSDTVSAVDVNRKNFGPGDCCTKKQALLLKTWLQLRHRPRTVQPLSFLVPHSVLNRNRIQKTKSYQIHTKPGWTKKGCAEPVGTVSTP
ncbi:MAG TPA: hypothetical protein DC058_16050 [Planctomycetaceae bacterium]|nr:hypothetical protein [Planctomycetaceae bacterium]